MRMTFGLVGAFGLAGLLIGCEEGTPQAEQGAVAGSCKSAVEQCVGLGGTGAACGEQLEGCVGAALSASSESAESLCDEVSSACTDAGGLPETCAAIQAACLELASAPPSSDAASDESAPPAEGSSESSSGEEPENASDDGSESPEAESEEGPSGEDPPPADPTSPSSTDVDPPTVVYQSVPSQVVAGTSFTFSWRASDPSGLAEGSSNAFIGGPSGWVTSWCGFAIGGVVVSVDGPSVLFEATCNVPVDAVSQTYGLFIHVQDTLANTASLSPESGGIGNFEVIGGSADAEPPLFGDVVGPTVVAPGAPFTLQWSVSDPSGIGGAAAWVAGPSGGFGDAFGPLIEYGEVEQIPVSDTESTFILSARVPERATGGTYVVWISAQDSLGNKIFEPTDTTFVVDCVEGLVQCLANASAPEVCAAAAAQCEAPADESGDGSAPGDSIPPEGEPEGDLPENEDPASPEDPPSSSEAPADSGENPSDDAESANDSSDEDPDSANSATASASPCVGGYLACKAAASDPAAPECKAALTACSMQAAG